MGFKRMALDAAAVAPPHMDEFSEVTNGSESGNGSLHD
jgi:hypothetical protein